MANAPRDTEPLQLRIERRISTPLREEAKRQGMANIQELIRKILEDFVSGRLLSDTNLQSKEQKNDIDLRELLMEAHRANTEANRIIGEAHKTIAELTRTITTLTEERKNTAAEPAGVVVPTGSTASSPRTPEQGRTKVITGLRQG